LVVNRLAGSEKAVSDDPGSAELHYHLANAYAETGRSAEALATARKALALATEQNNQGLAPAVRTRIAALEGQ